MGAVSRLLKERARSDEPQCLCARIVLRDRDRNRTIDFQIFGAPFDFAAGKTIAELIRHNFTPLAAVAGALSLYMVSTVAWIAALRTIPLSVAFMFNALAFVFIPIVSTIFFGEQLPRFFIPALASIALGIYLITLK